MKNKLKISNFWSIIFILFILVGCDNPIERSGVLVDRKTREPVENVSIDIYLKTQRRDSLKEKVFSDSNGHFFIKEKRDKGQLFLLQKSGYLGHVNSLSIANDTITMERESY